MQTHFSLTVCHRVEFLVFYRKCASFFRQKKDIFSTRLLQLKCFVILEEG
uniref:Uncharacterized protein n=1 Tax=Arundo donax TaxID=35708 RepID=A0A0A9BV20_ARUDO